jgi:putative PEP-CTERM system histidine kinase
VCSSDLKDLCSAVTKLVSDTFGVPSVTIWMVEESRYQFMLGGSTVFSEIKTLDEKRFKKEFDSLLAFMRTKQTAVDFHSLRDPNVEGFRNDHSDFLKEARIEYCVSLFAGQQYLGMMTLFSRLTKQPFSMEDFDLLKVIADQTAGSLLNLKLSQNLIKAKELEAFQSLSTFFIHDLKNLASTLSLTIKNLPLHYENPEFREDALKVISKSVDKMNGMCSRLALLTKKLELSRRETDLNKLINQVIFDLQGALKANVRKRFSSIPALLIDPDQIQKVLMNFVLNANEAIGGNDGEIQIATELLGENKICLMIRDNGCGISEEFLKRSLFQPFQTTKSHGLGIGLYHSKMIIEAHQGNIEVESREGEGTTFRIIFPAS